MGIFYNEKGQAYPGTSISMDDSVFDACEGTKVYWLGGAGCLINSRGTILVIDPLLEGFDMPLLAEPPISADAVKRADAVLITHIDNDHFSIPVCTKLKKVCAEFHTTEYVASVMRENEIPGTGHPIGDEFSVGDVKITLTPAFHNWQNEIPEMQFRKWKREDYCGFWIETQDGSIWMPGDSRLMEEHLHMQSPDLMLFDFSDNDWHIGFDNAVKLADTYPDADLLCIHWGTVDAPDFTPFNADPGRLKKNVVNPDRVLALAPGEEYRLQK